jgi:hypothetical protein
MTRIVIVGEIYAADLSVGGGPIYPGAPGGPTDPGFGVGWQPGGRPDHIWGQRPPHVGGGPIYPGHPSGQPVPPGGPVDPGYGRPGWSPVDPGWGGGPLPPHVGGGPAYGGGYPSGQPIVPPQGGTEVPPDEYQPAPPPEHIASQYIVSVYDPKTMTWTTKSYPPPPA